MIIFSLLLLVIGVFLSAFFSGSETGFYCASRVRLVMDGLDGDRIAKSMLKLFNNPTLFVATTLVGNNVANNLTSLAIVLVSRNIWSADSRIAEMLAPIAFSPLLFVYGELLPKQLFYMAPNQLLRRVAPLFLLFTILFAPVSAVLWSLARLLEKMLGQSPEKIRLLLARKELQKVLEEGQHAGILHPTQRHLGQNFFLVASKPVRSVCTPLLRVTAVPQGSKKDAVLRVARKHKLADIPVYRNSKTNIVGFVRTIDLLLKESDDFKIETIRKLPQIQGTELFGEALLQMQTNRETIAGVVSETGKMFGLLSIDQLTDPLLKGPLGSLRR